MHAAKSAHLSLSPRTHIRAGENHCHVLSSPNECAHAYRYIHARKLNTFSTRISSFLLLSKSKGAFFFSNCGDINKDLKSCVLIARI